MSLIPKEGVPPRTPLTDAQKVETLEAAYDQLSHEYDMRVDTINAYLAEERARKAEEKQK